MTRARAWWKHGLAAGLYLAVSLWAMRAVLDAPSARLPYAAALDRYATPLIEHNEYRSADIEKEDQKFVVSALAHHGRSLLTAPWSVFELPQCHPFASALTLGEHMLGAGLLAALPYALTQDPILSYNVVVILALWIPALAMYALVFYWTRSACAAFVSGLLFAIFPGRVFYPAHPFVHGNQWTPLAFLFAARLFERQRWRDAVGLVLFTGLQLMESPYQVLAFAILASVYGVYLLVRNRHALSALSGKLLFVIGSTALVVAAVFGPYLRTRARWPDVLRDQGTDYPFSLHDPSDLWFGGGAYVGSVALLLTALALIDRMRGERATHGHDPRLVYLTGGLLVAWTVVSHAPIPWLGPWLPSPLILARQLVPGIEAVRVPVLARLGVQLVAAFLAGYGVLMLVERLRPLPRVALTALVAALAFGEVFHPPAAEYAFRHPVEMTTYAPRPPPEDLALYESDSPGAVLDLPIGIRVKSELLTSHSYDYTFLQAFHGRPVAACFGSFVSPVVPQIAALASYLPDPEAADALAALGFDTIVLHKERMRPSALRRFKQGLARNPASQERLVRIGATPRLLAYRLTSPVATSDSFDLLGDAEARAKTVRTSARRAAIPFAFSNRGSETFRHPEPIVPSDLVVTWQSEAGETIETEKTRGLLPVALGAGAKLRVEIPTPLPPRDGSYIATLARAERPEVILARQEVLLLPASAPEPRSDAARD